MEVQAKLLVLGGRSFKDTIEGQAHDFTKMVVAMDVSEKDSPTSCKFGLSYKEMKIGNFAESEKLKALHWPQMCDLTLKLTTEGYEIVSLRPSKPAAPQA